MTTLEARTAPVAALANRAAELSRSIADHKRAIRFHREALAAAAAERAELEAECARRGHRLTTQPKGEAGTHGHRTTTD